MMTTAVSKSKQTLTMEDLLSSGLVPWTSAKTTIRKIKHEGFPGYQDGPGTLWYFHAHEIEMWKKQRKYKAS